MRAKWVFLLTSAIAFIVGIGYLLTPAIMLNSIGYSTADDAPLVGQFYGALILGFSIFTFLIRNEEHSSLRQWVFLLFVIDFILLVIIYSALFFLGTGNLSVWAVTAMHIILALLYAYLYLENR